MLPRFARRMLLLPVAPGAESLAIRPAATALLRTMGWHSATIRQSRPHGPPKPTDRLASRPWNWPGAAVDGRALWRGRPRPRAVDGGLARRGAGRNRAGRGKGTREQHARVRHARLAASLANQMDIDLDAMQRYVENRPERHRITVPRLSYRDDRPLQRNERAAGMFTRGADH